MLSKVSPRGSTMVNIKKSIIAELDACIEILENRRIVIKSAGGVVAKKYDKLFNAKILECYEFLVKSRDENAKKLLKEALRKLYAGELDSDELLNLFKKHLATKFAEEVTEPLEKWSESVYKLGMSSVPSAGVRLSYNVLDRSAVELMNEHNIFFIGKYYDRHNGNIMKNEIASLFANATTRNEIADMMLNIVDKDKMLSDNYYKGFVDNAASRIRNVGAIKRFERLGIKYYQIHATLDANTTEICREMNGRIIATERASSVVNDYLSIPTTDENGKDRPVDHVIHDIKALTPFWNDDKTQYLRGMTTDKIIQQNTGLTMPPFHWRCRSEVRSFYAEDVETYEFDPNFKGKDMSDYTRDYVKSFMKTDMGKLELFSKIESIDKTKWHYYNEALLERHQDHKQRFGIKSDRDFVEKGREIIKNAKYKGFRMFEYDKNNSDVVKTEFQMTYFGRDGMTVVNSNNEIVGIFTYKGRTALQYLENHDEYIILKRGN
jgi:hypothetical protein